MPKILVIPKDPQGRHLIRLHNRKRLEQAASTGDIAILQSLGRSLETKMQSRARKEAIAAAVAELIGQMKVNTDDCEIDPQSVSNASQSLNPDTKVTAPSFLKGDELRNLRLSFLLGPEFRGQYRDQVMGIGHSFTIRDVDHFLSRSHQSLQLFATFNTRTRRTRLQQAVNRFDDAVLKWRDGRRRDTRVKWIAGHSLSAPDLSYYFKEIDSIFRSLGGIREDRPQLFVEIKQWLPWVSVELINKIRAMTAAEMGLVRRSLARAAQYLGLQSDMYPWTPGFDGNMAELPIHSLYQFEPTTLALRTMNTLQSVHCSNLGHLAVFHPEAWKAIHALRPRVWSRLALALNE